MSESQLLVFLIVLLPASFLGLATKRLGFSSIIGYVIAGVLVGPVFNLVDINSPLLVFFSQLGIVLITFQIGLTVKLDFIKGASISAAVVVIEIIVVTGLVSLVGALLNLPMAAIFILIFMALNTSSAVVFHLIEEEKEMRSKPIGDIALGVGAFEDILSMIGLALLAVFTLATTVQLVDLARLLMFIAVTITLMLLFALRLAKHVIHYFGLTDKELLIILSAAFVITYAFIGELLGISIALGAFIAGLGMSSIIEAEEVKEKFLSFTDIAALFFFASIGASLPPITDLPLIALVVGISLTIIIIKYFSFSISSWILGAHIENSFRIGLYMLAISEFGIILALEGLRKGVVSQEIYLVSVIAMFLSTIIASSTKRYRDSISLRLAFIIPRNFRTFVETSMLHIKEALMSDKEELQNIKLAATELLRRATIIAVLAFVIGLLSQMIPPIFGEVAVIAEGLIIALGSLIILITAFQSKNTLSVLIHFALSRYRHDKTRTRIFRLTTSLAHLLIIGTTAAALIMFYSPFIEDLLDVFLTPEITRISIVILILGLFSILFRRVSHLMDRIDSIFSLSIQEKEQEKQDKQSP